jgi:hypothetical protein
MMHSVMKSGVNIIPYDIGMAMNLCLTLSCHRRALGRSRKEPTRQRKRSAIQWRCVNWYDDDDYNGACGCFVCAYTETKTAYSKTERAYSDNQNAYSDTKTPEVNPKLPVVER